MNKPKKCKNCQWYGKPYWGIINPCDNCPNENDYITQVGWYNEGTKQFEQLYTKDYVEELKKQYKKEELKLFHDNEILQTRIDKAVEYIEDIIERFNKINDKDLISNRLVDIEYIEKLFDILRGEE